MFIWALYFDNFPHGHYGTIRQQIWSLLHFPFQLAIVGVVEGSQQVALARYVLKNYVKIEKSIYEYCFIENLDGEKLRDKLMALVEYWQFEKKVETYGFTDLVAEYVYSVGNTTDICSPANATEYDNTGLWPQDFIDMTLTMFDGVYQGLGMKIPTDKLEKSYATEIAIHSWKIVYIYYWSSFCLLIACFVGFLILIRRHKADLFDVVSITIRLIAFVIGGILIALVASDSALYSFIGSPGVLPTCLVLLFLIMFFDRLSAWFCNWRLKKSGQPYAKEHEEEHHHGGDHGHDRQHEPHVEPYSIDHRKSAAWSIHSDTEPLTANTAYQPQHSYAMTPLMSPPVQSPPMHTPTPPHGHMSIGHVPTGGYMPVSHGQNYGA